MSIQHREDSIRDMKLERLGVTPPQDWNDVEQVRTAKKAEIGLACSAAIYAGIDVGGAHYSLTEHDQTELMAQFQTVKEGAEEVPYPHIQKPEVEVLLCAASVPFSCQPVRLAVVELYAPTTGRLGFLFLIMIIY